MKIYNIQLKRLTQTEADSKKDARKEGRNKAKGATRHATLHKDHSHSIHGARRATPIKMEQSLKESLELGRLLGLKRPVSKTTLSRW